MQTTTRGFVCPTALGNELLWSTMLEIPQNQIRHYLWDLVGTDLSVRKAGLTPEFIVANKLQPGDELLFEGETLIRVNGLLLPKWLALDHSIGYFDLKAADPNLAIPLDYDDGVDVASLPLPKQKSVEATRTSRRAIAIAMNGRLGLNGQGLLIPATRRSGKTWLLITIAAAIVRLAEVMRNKRQVPPHIIYLFVGERASEERFIENNPLLAGAVSQGWIEIWKTVATDDTEAIVKKVALAHASGRRHAYAGRAACLLVDSYTQVAGTLDEYITPKDGNTATRLTAGGVNQAVLPIIRALFQSYRRLLTLEGRTRGALSIYATSLLGERGQDTMTEKITQAATAVIFLCADNSRGWPNLSLIGRPSIMYSSSENRVADQMSLDPHFHAEDGSYTGPEEFVAATTYADSLRRIGGGSTDRNNSGGDVAMLKTVLQDIGDTTSNWELYKRGQERETARTLEDYRKDFNRLLDRIWKIAGPKGFITALGWTFGRMRKLIGEGDLKPNALFAPVLKGLLAILDDAGFAHTAATEELRVYATELAPKAMAVTDASTPTNDDEESVTPTDFASSETVLTPPRPNFGQGSKRTGTR